MVVQLYHCIGFRGVQPSEKMFIPRYFTNKKKLAKILNQFVTNIFSVMADNNGKKHWCEDTPANALHIDLLSQIFPEAYFIHIVRHPVRVAYSMKRVQWAPDNYESICNFLTNLYEKLIYIHEWSLNRNNIKYELIKLEDFATESEHDSISNFLQIENDFDGSIKITKERCNHYETLIDKSDRRFLEKKLSKYIDYFSY